MAVTLTEKAANHVQSFLARRGKGVASGGAGLGLAIVAESAKRLRAQLSLARTDEAGGATFSLIFQR